MIIAKYYRRLLNIIDDKGDYSKRTGKHSVEPVFAFHQSASLLSVFYLWWHTDIVKMHSKAQQTLAKTATKYVIELNEQKDVYDESYQLS